MMKALLCAVVLVVALSGCRAMQGAPVAVVDKGRPTQRSLMWPHIGFNDYRGPLGAKVVALTFDDGPDGHDNGGTHTGAVLDVLKKYNIAATFFVCGHWHSDLTTDAAAQRDLKRMVAEGHVVASHTLSHARLPDLTPADIALEFERNTQAAQKVLGPSFQFSLYRIPYGFPFQTNHAATRWVAPVTAAFGVHVGWGLDTDDWKCAQNRQDGACLLHNLRAQLDAGHSGPILMHSIYQLTAETLPAIIDLLTRRGYRFVTAEQLVKDHYGASSAEVMAAHKAAGFSQKAIGEAAVDACAHNQPIVVPY